MSKRIEMATNIVVLLVALLVGFKFLEGMLQRPVVIKAGQKIPDINGYRWSKSPTLVLALKKGLSLLRREHAILPEATGNATVWKLECTDSGYFPGQFY